MRRVTYNTNYKDAYYYCFIGEIKTEDKSSNSKTCGARCVVTLRTWVKNQNIANPFAVSMNCHEQTDHTTDCFVWLSII